MDSSFDWLDYTLFTVLIVLTLAIVAYFTFFKKASTVSEYIFGKGDLGVFPLTMSIIATNLSSIPLSQANDIYMYGASVLPTIIGLTCLSFFSLVQIPVLYPLKLESLNQYAALRFDYNVKLAISVVFMAQTVFHTTLISYSVGLFISQITGFSYFTTFVFLMISCYLLTTAGGFSGVVWTDTLQAMAMFISSFWMVFVGYRKTGSISAIYQRALDSGRLSFDWSFDPTHRLTIWTSVFLTFIDRSTGGTLFSPLLYQRFAAVPTESQAKRVAVFQVLGTSSIKCSIFLLGYVMYAAYDGCDPVRQGKVQKYDQMVAYFVQDVGSSVKLVRSVYIIGFISAAVSTLSTAMNTFAVTFYKDFLETPFNPKKYETRGKYLISLVGLILCIACIVIMGLLENAGTVFEMVSLISVPMMAHAAVYTMGLFMPCIDSASALWGTVIGAVPVMWLAIQSRVIHSRRLVKFPMKELRVDLCPPNSTINATNSTRFGSEQNVFILYRISPFVLPSLAFAMVILSAVFVRIFKGSDSRRIDPKLISPWVRRFLKPKGGKMAEEAMSLRQNDSSRP